MGSARGEGESSDCTDFGEVAGKGETAKVWGETPRLANQVLPSPKGVSWSRITQEQVESGNATRLTPLSEWGGFGSSLIRGSAQ